MQVTPDATPRCARRGCSAAATVDLQWRNPRIHDETRVKHWPACTEHEDYLTHFLSLRGFLLRKEPLG